MSASDHLYLRGKLVRYKSNYADDGDTSRYASNCTVAALALFLAEENERLKKMGKVGLVLPAALSASSPVFMAAIDTVAHQLSCPVDAKLSARQFLEHFTLQVGNRYDSEVAEPIRKSLKSVQDAFRSMGLLKSAK